MCLGVSMIMAEGNIQTQTQEACSLHQASFIIW